jgi:hypothetical protein
MSLGEVRDIALIVLVSISVLTTLILLITALLIWRLIRIISDEVKPIIKSTAETAAIVRAATSVASESRAIDILRSIVSLSMVGKIFSIFRRRK